MILYHLFLVLYLLPQLFLNCLRGKRYPQILQRFGWIPPLTSSKKIVWIHAVSVGEAKAALPFLSLCKEKWDAFVLITTTTKTGFEEAKRSLSQADAFYFLPLDFRFCVKRFIQRVHPSILFLMESDFWPNLLQEMKKSGGQVVLLNGKMSERSFRRWSFVPRLSRKVFEPIDLFCVQNEQYAASFRKLVQNPSKVHSTGNVKLDARAQTFPSFDFVSSLPLLTVSCTHLPEELWIVRALRNGPWKILLAPRHPERFAEVSRSLEKEGIRFARFGENLGNEEVVLIDAMGKLPLCYAKSQLAIVGGSFVPHVGGHNIFEPCLYGCPVIFGPFMSAQKDLVQKILSLKAGMQVPLEKLSEAVLSLLAEQAVFSKNAISLVEESRGATENCWRLVNILHSECD